MKFLSREQVLNLKLNVQSQIWTTGFIELDMDEIYQTPFGTLLCRPGFGWYFKDYKHEDIPDYPLLSSRYPLMHHLEKHGVDYQFDCPIIHKLHKKKTFGLVFKLLGYPNNSKCWI